MSSRKEFELKPISHDDTLPDIYQRFMDMPSALSGSPMEREGYLNELTRQLLRDEPTSL